MITDVIISKENILQWYGEYTIFKYYIPSFNICGKPFKSELRADNNASAIISEYNGKLHYYDFGTQEKYDVFSYVQKKYGLDFIGALNKIYDDLNAGKINKTIPIYKKNIEKANIIRVAIRKFNENDINYWYKKYGIKEDLLIEYNVFPVQQYSISDNVFITDKIAYAYYFGLHEGVNRWKIYQPYNKQYKWISNTNSSIIQGYEQLKQSHTLIITSSLKDVLVLNECGYNACALQAESTKLTESMLKSLQNKTDCKRIISIYDNDDTGIKYAEKLKNEYGIQALFMPEGTKDPSEFVETYDYFCLRDYVESYLRV